MYISKIALVNYRNFANANFQFQKGINTVIGENGAGKTNVFRAMRLLLEDSFYASAFKLSQEDFNRSTGDWRGRWIIISIEFDEISDDEAIQALFIHRAGDLTTTPSKKATYNLMFRPKGDIRKKLSDLQEGDKSGLDAILNEITALNIQDKYETCFTGKSTADFTDPRVYTQLVGDFENVKFNFAIDEAQFGVKIPHQLSVAREVSFTFIQALRDVVSDFHDNRKNPLLSLLKSQNTERKQEDYDPIAKMVDDLNSSIENLPDVQSIRNHIKDTIKDAVGETYSPSSLSIKSSLSAESDKLMQSLKLFIGEPEETYEGGIHELSLGGANLIFLTLKLLEYKYKSTSSSLANFLVIEEPEAHIHTHIQKTLFENLDYGDTQIFYSTHSTHISEVSQISSMNVLSKKVNHAEVYHPSNGLDLKKVQRLERYLDAVRSNLLFAKGVILIEGDAEEILIPIMVKKVMGLSLDELGITLVNIRSTGFENVSQIFHEQRLKRRCSIVTDLDAAICDTNISADDEPALKKYKANVAGSEKAGAKRKVELDSLAKDNKWVQPFYADHTFEVDFIGAGNVSQVVKLVEKIYTDPTTIASAKRELASSDLAVSGKRILTMAKQEGKGWFALMLGEYIDSKTVIPEYIFKAVAFAKGSFTRNITAEIIEQRIAAYDGRGLDFNEVNQKMKALREKKINSIEAVNSLRSIIPQDQIFNLFPAS